MEVDSNLRRSTEGESSGYSTDYGTLEVSRQSRYTLGDGFCSTSRAGSSVINDDVEKSQELLEPSSRTGRAQHNIGRRSLMIPVGGEDDGIEREEEKEDMMRDDPRFCPSTVNCYLIPPCVVHQWPVCRACYIIWIIILVMAIVITVGIGTFWGIQLFKYRSHISETVDLATSGSYEVTSEFPLSNIYGSNQCLRFDQSASSDDIAKLSYVSLVSEKCSDITRIIRNESLHRAAPLQYNNFMFHWLHGTTVFIHIIVNGTSVVTIYLLNDRVSEHYCSMHQAPENVVQKWMFDFSNCYLNVGGYMDCHLQTTINSSGTYFVCINSTIDVGLSYEINISSVVYNTSAGKKSSKCSQGEDCCLPFDDLFSEAVHPTCMYISTEAVSPDYLGMKLVDVNIQVGQRLSVIKYCFIILLVLLVLLGITVMCFLLTRCKVDYPSFDPRGCTIHCSVYGKNDERIY